MVLSGRGAEKDRGRKREPFPWLWMLPQIGSLKPIWLLWEGPLMQE